MPASFATRSVRFVARSEETGCWAISRAFASAVSTSSASGTTRVAIPASRARAASIHSAV